MTNGWIDIKNTDMMLIMGGNPAENHPCGFKWPIEAKRQRNAKMIVVDPRFTRTAATADLFLQIRAGADIAFLGGLIKYAIDNDRIAHEYLVNFTNAGFIIKEGFKLPEDGLYSGFDPATQIYDKSTWNYEAGGNVTGQSGTPPAAAATPEQQAAAQARTRQHLADIQAGDPQLKQKPSEALLGLGYVAGGPAGAQADPAHGPGKAPMKLPPNVAYDLSLQHPRSVFQLLKKQYSRYTPEMVERITGIPKDQFLKAADLFTSIRKDGDMKKVATIIYAVGWTQHSFGTQIIRTAAMLQLLLGNVGRAGGGVNALRGHSNIQGATDMAGIFDILPGYLKMPAPDDTDFATYLKRITPTTSKPDEWDSFNYWSNTPKFAVSFLKAMYGDAATKENDWAFHYLPKIDRKYSWTEIWDDMYDGQIKGMFAFGMNGVPDRPELAEEHRRAEEGRLAGGLRNLSRRDQRVLALAGHHCRRDEDDSDDGLSSAVRRLRREGRHLRQLGALAAMEEHRGAAARARPGSIRKSWRGFSCKVRELYQKEGGAFPDPILNCSLELHRSAESVARRGREGDQRPGARRHHRSDQRPDHQGGPATARLRLAERRRHDAVRQLALLRIVDRSRRHDRSAAAPRIRRGSASIRTGRGRGRRIGASVQPRLVRSRRASRGTPSAGRSGGTRRQERGSATTCRISRSTRRRRITWVRSS